VGGLDGKGNDIHPLGSKINSPKMAWVVVNIGMLTKYFMLA
jgi:hypothetical protein